MEEQIYIFKVSPHSTRGCVVSRFKNIYRKIELKGATSLYHLAEAILGTFGFYFDHPFGFHDNIENIYASNEVYTLFYDQGFPIDPKERSVKQSHVYKVFEVNKKMIFHFDYGDDWEFLVECLGVTEPEAGKKYPRVTEKKGKAPPQYPPCDE